MSLSVIKLILFFLIMTGIVCCGGIMIMNEGLKKYDSISILSLYQGSFILSSSLSGILFFHEFDNTVIVFFIIILAIYIISLCIWNNFMFIWCILYII